MAMVKMVVLEDCCVGFAGICDQTIHPFLQLSVHVQFADAPQLAHACRACTDETFIAWVCMMAVAHFNAQCLILAHSTGMWMQ